MNTTLRLAAVAFGLLLFPLLTSCSTTRGFGQDLQNLGEEIEQEAVEAQY